MKKKRIRVAFLCVLLVINVYVASYSWPRGTVPLQDVNWNLSENLNSLEIIFADGETLHPRDRESIWQLLATNQHLLRVSPESGDFRVAMRFPYRIEVDFMFIFIIPWIGENSRGGTARFYVDQSLEEEIRRISADHSLFDTSFEQIDWSRASEHSVSRVAVHLSGEKQLVFQSEDTWARAGHRRMLNFIAQNSEDILRATAQGEGYSARVIFRGRRHDFFIPKELEQAFWDDVVTHIPSRHLRAADGARIRGQITRDLLE